MHVTESIAECKHYDVYSCTKYFCMFIQAMHIDDHVRSPEDVPNCAPDPDKPDPSKVCGMSTIIIILL